MKCPTLHCPNTLPPGARRRFCKPCRQSMRYHDSKTPAELVKTEKRLNKQLFRMEHAAERKMEATPHDYRKQRKVIHERKQYVSHKRQDGSARAHVH